MILHHILRKQPESEFMLLEHFLKLGIELHLQTMHVSQQKRLDYILGTPQQVLMNQFVHKLTAAEQARVDERNQRRAHRIDINDMVLTDHDTIISLFERLQETKTEPYILTVPPKVTYSGYALMLIKKETKAVKLLTKLPPFYRPNVGVVFFP
jgi:hypothetical protein